MFPQGSQRTVAPAVQGMMAELAHSCQHTLLLAYICISEMYSYTHWVVKHIVLWATSSATCCYAEICAAHSCMLPSPCDLSDACVENVVPAYNLGSVQSVLRATQLMTNLHRPWQKQPWKPPMLTYKVVWCMKGLLIGLQMPTCLSCVPCFTVQT